MEKHIHTIVFMFCSKINEFGRKKLESDEKKQKFKKKTLKFFLRVFAFFVRPNFEKKNRKKVDKKKATQEGRPRPSIFHPNLPKIHKVTSPFLCKAVYSYILVNS